MAKTPDFELPLPTEKLSYKFILDTLKEEMTERTVETVEKIELVEEKVCGGEAPAVTYEENFPKEKKYFRIGEVAEIVGVEAYVLRYWETEFKSIKPTKSGTGHRVYSRKDVEKLLQIKKLLHEERFSIKGAKQKLQELKKEAKVQEIQESPKNKAMKSLLHEVKELITLAKQAI